MIDTVNYRLHGCNQQKMGIINKMLSETTSESIFLVPSHADLFHAIYTTNKNTFTTTKFFNEEKLFESQNSGDLELAKLTSNKVNEHFFSLNKVEYQSAEYVKQRNSNLIGKQNIPSSEYNVTFSCNPNAGTITFNVSIPKYLYGHNMAQFIPQPNSEKYFLNNLKANNWDFQKSILFERFMKFTKLFFYNLFLSLEISDKPDFRYIEVTRIDLCYNQYFDTKKDALYYQSLQKKLAKKSKIYEITDLDYGTTLAFKTQRGFYFKIYHKGSEYLNTKHGDFSHHTKVNSQYIDILSKKSIKPNYDLSNQWEKLDTPEKLKKHKETLKRLLKSDTKKTEFVLDKSIEKEVLSLANETTKNLPFDTLFLRQEMDKILRYEVSLKVKYFAYQYNNYLFRKDCKIYQNAKKQYKFVKRKYNNKDRFNYKPPNYLKKNYDTIQNFLGSVGAFVLSNERQMIKHSNSSIYDYDSERDLYQISKYYKWKDRGTLLETRFVHPFSKSLLNHLVNDFRKVIDFFQIKELEPFDTLQKRVIDYNNQVQKNINLSKLNIYELDKNQKKRYDKLLQKYKPEAITLQMVLTEKEKLEKGLQKMSYTNLMQVFNLMYNEGLSTDQVRKKLNLSSSQFYRRLKYLKMLGYDESSLNTEIHLKPKTDFSTYYSKLSYLPYRKSFFLNSKMSKIS